MMEGFLVTDPRALPEVLMHLGIIHRCAQRCQKDTTIPMDSVHVNDAGEIRINGICANVICYQILVPDKVMLVEFADGKREKMVLNPADKFDIDTGIRIAIAKHVGRKYYNEKGIEYLATKLSHLKCIDKMIHKAHVEFRRRERIAEKAKKAAPAKKRKRLNITKKPHHKDN